VQELLDMLKERMPALVSELIPDRLGAGEVQRVLQQLLKERVSIRNLAVILETLSDYAGSSRDPEVLTEYVRLALGRQIVADYVDSEGRLTVITLDPRIEERVAGSLQTTTTGVIPVLPPPYLSKLVENTATLVQQAASQGLSPVFLVSPRIRPYLRKLLEKLFKGSTVLSYGEIAGELELRTLGTVENPDAKPAQ
jgi:flagellar biosynthesis protein FlhA